MAILTEADRGVTAVARAEALKIRNRRAHLSQQFAHRSLAGEVLEEHADWEEFLRIDPGVARELAKQSRAERACRDRDALIAECTAPIPPNMQYMAQEEWMRRNNLLLAAILKHLTRDS